MALPASDTPPPESPVSLAGLFLRLGATSFGGPAAHIAMMEEEFVRRRKWLSHEEFLDLIGAANLIPGPNSTEVAMHIGLKRGGWPGFLIAGVCFILPAYLIVMAIAWAYVRFGTLPQATGLLAGVKPVIIAVIAQALWGLGKSALKKRSLVILATVAVIANFMGVHELLILFLAGLIMALAARARGASSRWRASAVLPAVVPGTGLAPIALPVAATAAAAATPFGLWPLFLFFLKVGAVLYGSGYVLLAFIRTDLVERLHWLTEAQLLDAVAVGQLTPGPLFTTATFVGYVLGGPAAATVATIGIFLPAFFFVAISAPLIPRIRRSRVAGAFLDGVNAASLSLMVVVTLYLGRSVLLDPSAVAITLLSLGLLIRYKINSAWLVLGGGLIGMMFL